MFGPPGFLYVYFTYGMHFCANLVCQPPGRPEAVLLRAGEIITGADLAARRREGSRAEATGNGATARRRALDLARGPARLCQALGIDRAQDGADACAAGSAVGIGPGPAPPPGTEARHQHRPPGRVSARRLTGRGGTGWRGTTTFRSTGQ